MKVEYIVYFFTLLILFVKPGPSESTNRGLNKGGAIAPPYFVRIEGTARQRQSATLLVAQLRELLRPLTKLAGKLLRYFVSKKYTYWVRHKFSYTWNELFVVNWFISFFLRKYQMKKSIIPTLSEKFNQIKQTWHQLQPQM